jgi:hypothetical protein
MLVSRVRNSLTLSRRALSPFLRLMWMALAILLLDATAPAQQPLPAAPAPAPPATQEAPDPQPQRPPLIRRGVNFVSVDVIVTEAKTGAIVLDLNKEDFEIREDRKPQRLDTFEVVDIARAALWLTLETLLDARETPQLVHDEIRRLGLQLKLVTPSY